MQVRRGSKRLIRDLNQSLLLDLVRRGGPISRVELARRTRLGRSTVNEIVNGLVRDGLLREAGNAETASVGRPPVLLRFNPEARYVVGLKLAPTRITAALTDLDARVITRSERELAGDFEPAHVVRALAEQVRAVVHARDISDEQLLGVGVVLPGLIDPATGIALASQFLHWRNIPLRAALAEALSLPVFVDNDANAFALAEHWYGAGRGCDELLVVTVGIGIGAGTILHGQLYRGSRDGAGELGHMVMNGAGPLCVCGKHGCLESYAADAGIVRLAREAAEQGLAPGLVARAGSNAEVTRELVVEAARQGDGAARRILSAAGGILGVALANAIGLLNPARIVVGGETTSAAGELLLDPARAAIREHAFSILADEVEVIPASLGPDAWLMGAATLVLEEVFKTPIFARTVEHRPLLTLANLVEQGG